jgi:DNA-binding CsgD family transcriptional regulator
VEALEALRLLDAAAAGLLPLAVEHSPLPFHGEGPIRIAPQTEQRLDSASAAVERSTWDLALGQEALADDYLGLTAESEVVDERALESGLNQLNRYLARAWTRAGISPQQQDDCTQTVHTVMLQQVGRAEFDGMLADIGRRGIPRVLSRESALGPDFFRAVDMIKKRAQRQRGFLTLDEHLELAAPAGGDDAEIWRGALHDAIDRTLNPREADLIRATLEGFSPAEIALQWGLAPKTISNEKTRAFQKLREALEAELYE